MGLKVVQMILPVLMMIGTGFLCRNKKIIDQGGLKAIRSLIGDVLLPVMLFNAFFSAAYSLRTVVVFLVVFCGYGIAIALGFALRPLAGDYGKFFPFLLSSGEGGMLGYALYALLLGEQSGFAVVDLGQTVFAYMVWLALLKSVDGGGISVSGAVKQMVTNRCFQGMMAGILLGALGLGKAMLSSPAGGIYSAVVSMFTAPIGALVLIMVGYELSFKADLLKVVARTILIRLVIMALLLMLANLVIFRLFPFDKELEVALMILYALPAPYIIPIFAEVKDQGEYVATTISLHTLTTVALFALIGMYVMA